MAAESAPEVGMGCEDLDLPRPGAGLRGLTADDPPAVLRHGAGILGGCGSGREARSEGEGAKDAHRQHASGQDDASCQDPDNALHGGLLGHGAV